MNLTYYLENFWDYIFKNKKETDIYNEFSFQHELGIYLRDNLPEDYKVQFERNVSFFGNNMDDFKSIPKLVKKEIDIAIYKYDDEKVHSCHAIELKYPRNGQYPDSMYAFIKDIKFMEQLNSAGFENTYCMVMVDNEDKLFYSNGKKDGIYQYFRDKQEINGKIYKQTGNGKNEKYYDIQGKYTIIWIPKCNNKWMMYQIKTNNKDDL